MHSRECSQWLRIARLNAHGPTRRHLCFVTILGCVVLCVLHVHVHLCALFLSLCFFFLFFFSLFVLYIFVNIHMLGSLRTPQGICAYFFHFLGDTRSMVAHRDARAGVSKWLCLRENRCIHAISRLYFIIFLKLTKPPSLGRTGTRGDWKKTNESFF